MVTVATPTAPKKAFNHDMHTFNRYEIVNEMESILSYLKYFSYRLLTRHVISARDNAKHVQEEYYHRNCNDINLQNSK